MRTQPIRMVDVELSDEDVIITPRGIWKLWSLCRTKRIPYRAISGARLSMHADRELRPRWRNPGLGTFTTLAGYTSGPNGRTWWCYKYGRNAVVLDLMLPKLKHVVFIDDRGSDIVGEIRARLHAFDDRRPSGAGLREDDSTA